MELTKVLGLLATVLPLAYGAPLQAATDLHPDILAAMKRDLGMDAEQATARIAREISAGEVIEKLRSSMGDAFAGAWVADNGNTINVGVTDKAKADEVTAAGAKPAIMSNSLSKLTKAKEALDKLEINKRKARDTKDDSNQSGVASWFVDVAENKLVLQALDDSTDYAEELAAEVGLGKSEFEVRTVKEMPTTFATVRGGDAYMIGSGRCSVGFSVDGGFVTAGHCGTVGTSTSTSDGETLGTFEESDFPGSDMAFVSTESGHTLTATINGYGSSDLPVSGNSEAPIGASICRSGSTTGVHCGEVDALGVTVNYAEGSVSGLTGTTVCAEPGDSGGSFYAGDQAQGMTSGGSGSCTIGGETFFQPLNEALSNYGLSLITS